eukprot:TRINITY_DN32550_c0_g1_i1.p1 TRINITY_DN32550_c0_g1~~TRINITY_DN32550_c0_g1_i1.p1  ORF type:complete len:552 (+),score=90.53 TRINITY_DN32550_c0_g1_i1:61-1716(+)
MTQTRLADDRPALAGSGGCRPRAPLTFWAPGFAAADVRAALVSRGWRTERSGGPPLFSRFGRKTRAQRAAQIRAAAIRPYPYEKCLRLVSDKVMCTDELLAAGRGATLPESYTCLESWQRRPQGASEGPEMWFVKTADGRRAQGVEVCRPEEVPSVVEKARCPCAIQKGVGRPLCYDGHKVVFRHHVLVTPGMSVYVHADGLAVLSAEPYDPGSTSRSVQVLSAHQGGSNDAERLPMSIRANPEAFKYEAVKRGAKDIARGIGDVLAPHLRWSLASFPGVKFYALLGIDSIWDEESGSLKLLEVNEFPALCRSNQGPDARKVCSATVTDFISFLVCPAAEGVPLRSGGWEFVWTAKREKLAQALPAPAPRRSLRVSHSDPTADAGTAAEADAAGEVAAAPDLADGGLPAALVLATSALPSWRLPGSKTRTFHIAGDRVWRCGDVTLQSDRDGRWTVILRHHAGRSVIMVSKHQHRGRAPHLVPWLHWTGSAWEDHSRPFEAKALPTASALASGRSPRRGISRPQDVAAPAHRCPVYRGMSSGFGRVHRIRT